MKALFTAIMFFDTKILIKQFPDHSIQIIDRPFKKRTQTEIHGNKANESGEKYIILFKQ